MRGTANRLLLAAMVGASMFGCRTEHLQQPQPLLYDGRQLLQVRLGYPADAKLLILNADDRCGSL
jgi:hypothetical protein